MQLNNKKIYIIISLATTVLLMVIGISVYINQRNISQINEDSKILVTKWANFKDQGSQQYLNSLKPYITDELMSQFSYDAEQLNSVVSNVDTKPASSKFIITGSPKTKRSKKSYVTEIRGSRQYSEEEKISENVTIVWLKVKGHYLANEIYSNN